MNKINKINYIEYILTQLSAIKGFNFYKKIKTPIADNQVHCFSINTQDSTMELYVDKKLTCCYFICFWNNNFNLDILLKHNGEVIFSNTQSKLIPEQKDINLKITQILSSFKNQIGKPVYSIENICHHFFDHRFNVTDRYPIPLKYCHVVKKNIFDDIKLLQDKVRNKFNAKNQNCNNVDCKDADKIESLVESHLISANNIRLLGGSKKSKVYFGTRFFQDLQEKPLKSLNTISNQPRNFRNRNFIIACFCSPCENKFKKTDENLFEHITEVTDEIINKSFGIYLQELRCNKEYINKVKIDSRFSQVDLGIFKEHENINDLLILENKIKLLKEKKLNKFQHHSVYKLKEKPFIESVSLSFHNNNYYLIYITNKEDKMHINIVTDDPKFPREINLLDLGNIISASISLGSYAIYSEDFYNNFSDKASDMMFEYFNHKRSVFIHPLLFTLIKHVKEVNSILNKYIHYSKFNNKNILRIIQKDKYTLISNNYEGYFIKNDVKVKIELKDWLKSKHEIGETFYYKEFVWIYTNTSQLEYYYEKDENVYILIV